MHRLRNQPTVVYSLVRCHFQPLARPQWQLYLSLYLSRRRCRRRQRPLLISRLFVTNTLLLLLDPQFAYQKPRLEDNLKMLHTGIGSLELDLYDPYPLGTCGDRQTNYGNLKPLPLLFSHMT